MLEQLARKCQSGDVWISTARKYLRENEWGLAYQAVRSGLEKGAISDAEETLKLLGDIIDRLGIVQGLPDQELKRRYLE